MVFGSLKEEGLARVPKLKGGGGVGKEAPRGGAGVCGRGTSIVWLGKWRVGSLVDIVTYT